MILIFSSLYNRRIRDQPMVANIKTWRSIIGLIAHSISQWI